MLILLLNFNKNTKNTNTNDSSSNKLTPEQQKLVEDNHNLIYGFMSKYGYDEEYYDILAIALCRAAKSFDNRKNVRFSVYVYKCMRNIVIREYKKTHSQKRIPKEIIFSYDEKKKGVNPDEEYDCLDFDINYSENELGYNSVETDDFMSYFTKELTDRENNVLKLLLEKYTYREIAEKIGLSHQSICLIKKKIVDKYMRSNKSI